MQKVMRGESLTLEEQREIISSHEQLRARHNVLQRQRGELVSALDEEKKRVDRLILSQKK